MRGRDPFRLLLVEETPHDSLLSLERIASVLGEEFAFRHVATMEEAQGLLRQIRFDAVVLDLDPDEASGQETLRYLEETYKGGVIIVLSVAPTEAQRRFLARGYINDLIGKNQPFADQLTRSILFWVEQFWVRAEHEQLEMLIAVNPDAVIVTNEDGIVLFVNEAALALFGKAEDELLGESMGVSINEGTVSEIEILRRTENRTAEMRVVRCTWQGEPAFLASIRDITERKRAEEAMRKQAEDLARSNQDLQQFAYVASHDLQEPLRTITSFAQLLEKRYKGQLDDQADRWINHIVDGAGRMQTLIGGLLTYSRVSTHGNEMRLCDTNEVFTLARKNVQATIEEADAEVTCGVLPGVYGDKIQLILLFQNLIANAIKYRSEKRPSVHIEARQEGSEWIFAVRDNGIGIEPQFFERIFIIFQRLHTRRKYPGNGIGLTVCKRIVDRHGGRIWVESEIGQGAVFYFTLPAAPANLKGANPYEELAH